MCMIFCRKSIDTDAVDYGTPKLLDEVRLTDGLFRVTEGWLQATIVACKGWKTGDWILMLSYMYCSWRGAEKAVGDTFRGEVSIPPMFLSPCISDSGSSACRQSSVARLCDLDKGALPFRVAAYGNPSTLYREALGVKSERGKKLISTSRYMQAKDLVFRSNINAIPMNSRNEAA